MSAAAVRPARADSNFAAMVQRLVSTTLTLFSTRAETSRSATICVKDSDAGSSLGSGSGSTGGGGGGAWDLTGVFQKVTFDSRAEIVVCAAVLDLR